PGIMQPPDCYGCPTRPSEYDRAAAHARTIRARERFESADRPPYPWGAPRELVAVPMRTPRGLERDSTDLCTQPTGGSPWLQWVCLKPCTRKASWAGIWPSHH